MSEKRIIELYGSLERKEMIYAQQFLNETDYITNKILEYQVLGKELEQDYTETLIKREEARQVIRELEK